jgi:hypothetical protein
LSSELRDEPRRSRRSSVKRYRRASAGESVGMSSKTEYAGPNRSKPLSRRSTRPGSARAGCCESRLERKRKRRWAGKGPSVARDASRPNSRRRRGSSDESAAEDSATRAASSLSLRGNLVSLGSPVWYAAFEAAARKGAS